MPINALILWENRKNRTALGAPLSDPLCLRWLRALPPDPHIISTPLQPLRHPWLRV